MYVINKVTVRVFMCQVGVFSWYCHFDWCHPRHCGPVIHHWHSECVSLRKPCVHLGFNWYRAFGFMGKLPMGHKDTARHKINYILPEINSGCPSDWSEISDSRNYQQEIKQKWWTFLPSLTKLRKHAAPECGVSTEKDSLWRKINSFSLENWFLMWS